MEMRFQQMLLAIVSLALGPGAVAAEPPRLLGADSAANTLLEIDLRTGHGTVIGPLGFPVIAAMAYDAANDIVYGASTGTNRLVTIDPATGATTFVGFFGTEEHSFHAMEFHPVHGLLYAVQECPNAKLGAELYVVDPASGAVFLIGTNDVVEFPGDLAFDAVNDIMYLSDTSAMILYSIDLSDGSVQFVMNIGRSDQGAGMAWHDRAGLIASAPSVAGDGDDMLYEFDPDSGRVSLIGPIHAGPVLALTFIWSPVLGDLDGDGDVDGADLAELLGEWGPCDGCNADLDEDGAVGAADLAILLGAWSI